MKVKDNKLNLKQIAFENAKQSIKGKEVIDVTYFSLNKWLKFIFDSNNKDYLFIDYMFPSEEIREEYLEKASARNEKEVINLIRKFLIPSGNFNGDYFNLAYLNDCYNHDKTQFKKLMKIEYYRRLIESIKNKTIGPWEGNTWVINLLPDHPKLAIDVLDAYFLAHIQLLPDGRFTGLPDAMAIIRAKFINYKHPKSVLLNLNGHQFEYLISALYKEMGYTSMVTSQSKDGGIDVIAEKDRIGEKEKLFIQCKRYQKNVGISYIRDLYGTVSKDKANKGILVTTSNFTKPACKFVSNDSQLELINGDDLIVLLNTYLGANWPSYIDYIITNEMEKKEKNVI